MRMRPARIADEQASVVGFIPSSIIDAENLLITSLVTLASSLGATTRSRCLNAVSAASNVRR